MCRVDTTIHQIYGDVNIILQQSENFLRFGGQKEIGKAKKTRAGNRFIERFFPAFFCLRQRKNDLFLYIDML